jgi:hypothetical protein
MQSGIRQLEIQIFLIIEVARAGFNEFISIDRREQRNPNLSDSFSMSEMTIFHSFLIIARYPRSHRIHVVSSQISLQDSRHQIGITFEVW